VADRDYLAAGVAGRAAARRVLVARWVVPPISDGDVCAIVDAALEAALPHLAFTLPADAIATVRPGDKLLIVWPDCTREQLHEVMPQLREQLGDTPIVVLSGDDIRVAVIQGDDVALGTATEPGREPVPEDRGGATGSGTVVGTGGASEAAQGAQR
jgi:hypothetical protein